MGDDVTNILDWRSEHGRPAPGWIKDYRGVWLKLATAEDEEFFDEDEDKDE